ncbi:FAD-dependent monooxygenase [Alkalihalobacillus sp. CinArs1]|uniref:FAD-dependent monooxygenase n=1 Tax=Alkalihalobacillus sp. CinArs1 TaxID=2995314 RepID=UPI0022DD709B|nr:FAD-dependent monooxygenase [Alkalihalobacillus sp. CinArs1]
MKANVLIVGAGPTGLAMALTLTKLGVPFRIIEKNKGPGETSRALVTQARILEHYQQLGVSDKFVKEGIPLTAVHIRNGGEDKAELRLKDIGGALSPFPYVLSLPQDVYERLLVKELENAGVEIEWNTELVSFTNQEDGVKVILKQDGHEECQFDYICGCDGAHSTVRHGMETDFPGGTYDQQFFVADVEAESDSLVLGDMYMNMEANGFFVFMPVRKKGIIRLIGIVPEDVRAIDFWEIYPTVQKKLDLTVSQVNWFSTYKVHHRVSEKFREGRVFLAGDAAHIHSPAGGQGMNTGIGDAVNLAWKLASVVKGKASRDLLETYEQERRAFANSLVSTTDRAFTNIIGQHRRGKVLRTVFFPYVLPFLLRFPSTRKGVFKTISQTRIHYHESMLSVGTAGKRRGGDRLPWVQNHNNYEALQSFDWQIHVYGTVKQQVRDELSSVSIPVHAYEWDSSVEAAGLQESALYLVRPDGYIGFVGEDVEDMKRYLNKFQIETFF